MDQRPAPHHTPQRGGPPKHGPPQPHQQPKRNYKLLVDPILVNGASKLYR